MCPVKWFVAGALLSLFGLDARAWNVADLSGGTNYISSPGGYTNNVYFSSYSITNDTATTYSNIWVRMGTFTNGAGAPNIALQFGAANKQILPKFAASSSLAVFFCLNGTDSASSATNAISLYSGDPDNGGTLLTNVLFTLNRVILVTSSANGSSAGTNYLSTTQPVLGGFLTITSTFTAGSASSKSGLYASYPAISNSWSAATFTLISNSFSILSVDTGNDFTNFQNQIVGYVPWSKASTITNVAVFRVVNTKPTATPISSGAFVNTGNGAIPNYVLPSDAGVLNPIPPATNRLTLTNWASTASAYTNTTVYFTNLFSNAAALDVQVDDLICTLPPGFVYAGSATFGGAAINNPATNAPTATNYIVTFSQGYVVPANGGASLVFAAIPTNAVNADGTTTNRTVLGTYASYGLIGTNHIDLTYDTADNFPPTNQVRVLLEPTATTDAYAINENAALNVSAPGVLSNDIEPNGFTTNVFSYTQPAHGAVTVTNNGGLTYTPTTYFNGSDSFNYTMTNNNARVSTATVNLTVNFVNQPPTLNSIGDLTTNVNASQQSVTLSGITSGTASASGSTILESSQNLTVTAISDTASLIPNPTVNYTSAGTTGTLTFMPVAHATGTAMITVIVQDSGGTAGGGIDSVTNTFTVTANKLNSSTSVSSSANPSVYGQSSVNFTATVSGSGNTPAGTVQFQTNGVNFGSAVSLSGGSTASGALPTTLPPGSYTVTALYGGDTDYSASTSSILTQIIGNSPPAANPALYYRNKDVSLKISITNLIALYTSQPQGDPVGLVSVTGGLLTNNTFIATTTNGTPVYFANPYKNGAYIVLTPTNNLSESFAYVVQDVGYPTLMATNLITIVVTNGVGQLTGQITRTNSILTTTWAGIPGLSYDVQRNTNLVSGTGWVTLFTTNAPVAGVFSYADPFTDLGAPPDSAYYRLRQN